MTAPCGGADRRRGLVAIPRRIVNGDVLVGREATAKERSRLLGRAAGSSAGDRGDRTGIINMPALNQPANPSVQCVLDET